MHWLPLMALNRQKHPFDARHQYTPAFYGFVPQSSANYAERVCNHFSEQQQNLCLSICQRVALNVVAVVIVFNNEALVQLILFPLAQWL